MIDPQTKQSGENKQAYCQRRGWGGGWKPGDLKQWAWWPNTLNAHQVCVYLEEMDATNSELTQPQKDQRSLALVQKLFELTYERDCNISTPEGAAQAIQELGYGTATEAVQWLEQQNGKSKVLQRDMYAKQDLDIHGVPHFVVSDGRGSGGSKMELHGAVNARAFLDALSDVSGFKD
jgi:predicted DsbA family dithiol-disulfide isomerase